MELFAQHSTLFTEYLYEDYPEILRCIRAWNAHDNYDVKKIAQRSYDTFLLGVRMEGNFMVGGFWDLNFR